jgi:LysR family carnitine catabolism transcriptional activator
VVDRAFASAGIRPDIAVETGEREATIPLVIAGAGISFLPQPQAEEAARRGAVIAGLSPPLRRTIGFVYRRRPLSPAALAFLEIAREGHPEPRPRSRW